MDAWPSPLECAENHDHSTGWKPDSLCLAEVDLHVAGSKGGDRSFWSFALSQSSFLWSIHSTKGKYTRETI